ncbi:hypothetical protein DIPPA_07776 [Diplonema papillatum]|nr:hypothetical protein DIPPA_07776 [Diplonema papillatum]
MFRNEAIRGVFRLLFAAGCIMVVVGGILFASGVGDSADENYESGQSGNQTGTGDERSSGANAWDVAEQPNEELLHLTLSARETKVTTWRYEPHRNLSASAATSPTRLQPHPQPRPVIPHPQPNEELLYLTRPLVDCPRPFQ